MSLQDSPLGKQTQYVSEYAPHLLHPIPRAANRQGLGLKDGPLPFLGVDIWNGYELSWLNPKGKPEVAVAEFRIPCESPNIIESKSFKLYLNSLNQSRFASFEAVEAALCQDLSEAAGCPVAVKLFPLADAPQTQRVAEGDCIDGLDIEVEHYHPAPELLQADSSELVQEVLVSHLLKSNCPVTGQPDWASVIIDYDGPRIDRASLLRYIISFRDHQDFHEHCVERMFCDLRARCQPRRLSVHARYTRRGGLDINPVRATSTSAVGNPRLVRQ